MTSFFKTWFKIDSIAQGKLDAIQSRLKKNKEAEAEKKKAQKWANDISTMLMSDGPYEGNIEGAKRQVENIEKIMAENEKRRNENSSALPSERNRDWKFDFLGGITVGDGLRGNFDDGDWCWWPIFA